ncbi:hypothetical protein ElyMa_003164400 [Elysia marginata]|uniref:Uncharacterized protein n=1 Tax=Elysia marginata TaxID=1093978 RepID=A0AAV4IVM6_9GAST|nr:hypothetical protein ElyMa_003164400 [Elysia marginata]
MVKLLLVLQILFHEYSNITNLLNGTTTWSEASLFLRSDLKASGLSLFKTNCKESSKKEIKVNGQLLESVTKFKYLGSIISDEGSKPEILS